MSESDLLKTRKSIVLQGGEILQTFVWSGANKLSPPPPNCYPLLPLVTPITPCYLLLPLLPLVTPCYLCYPLLPLVTPVTPCFNLLPLLPLSPLVTPVTRCYQLLPLNTLCYPLYPLLSYFEKIAHMSVERAYVSLWLCNLVTLYVRMFVARANKVEGTISWCLGTNEILAFT